jgi:hypothetical protein
MYDKILVTNRRLHRALLLTTAILLLGISYVLAFTPLPPLQGCFIIVSITLIAGVMMRDGQLQVDASHMTTIQSLAKQLDRLRSQHAATEALLTSLTEWQSQRCDLDDDARVLRLDPNTNRAYACNARELLPGDLWRPIYK